MTADACTTHSPAIDPMFNCTAITNEVGESDYAFYWSGTTHAGFHGAGAAMYVAFGRAAGWLPAMVRVSGQFHGEAARVVGAQRRPEAENLSRRPQLERRWSGP